MKNTSEYNKLASRFKQLAESPELEYQPADWTALAERLDKEEDDDKVALPFFKYGLFGLISLLVLLGGWVTFAKSNEPDMISAHQAETLTNETKLDKVISDAIVPAAQVELSDSPAEAKQQDDLSVTDESSELKAKPQNGQTEIQENAVPLRKVPSINDNLMVGETSENNSESDGPHSESQQPTSVRGNEGQQDSQVAKGADNSSFDTTSKLNSSRLSKQEVLPFVDELALLIIPLEMDESLDERLARILEELSIVPLNASDGPRPKIFIAASLAIEQAQSPNGDNSDSDINVGLQLGYVTGSKLVVRAGVNYVKESYLAAGDDYSPPAGFWMSTEGRAPDQVQAVCDMIDFSIGADYHFSDVRDRGLVAHFSTTTNYMLREAYDYRFTDPAEDWSAEFEGESRTLLSSLELGASYKFKLGQQIFIDAGPYVKLPTRGIGHGAVKLRTVGLRIGMSMVK